MSIKRYVATADTTITNALKDGLVNSGSLSNMGAADSLEVFYLYGQVDGIAEKSRILTKFPIDSIESDRESGDIPGSGSVKFFLKLSNAEHPFTLPRQYTLTVAPVSSSWEEGTGLDMDNYEDLGEANWLMAESGTAWTTPGGDFHSSPRFDAYFDRGFEDLEIDISSLVEQWIDGTKSNYGLGIFLSSSQEVGTLNRYTKKFFARGSEFFHKRPYIEARWDSARKDNRANFYASSSLAAASENLMTLYLYNYVRGQLRNIPAVGTGSIYVTLHTSASGGSSLTPTPQNPVTGGWVAPGVYTASFALDTTASVVYDRWFLGSTGYYTGTIEVKQLITSWPNPNPSYVVNITNMKPSYSRSEQARFRVFTKDKSWMPEVYSRMVRTIKPSIIEDAYFRVFRVVDDYEVIGYGTGSTEHTRLSYDVSGSYFDLDIGMLESGYSYAVQFAYRDNGEYRELSETFKFRVRD